MTFRVSHAFLLFVLVLMTQTTSALSSDTAPQVWMGATGGASSMTAKGIKPIIGAMVRIEDVAEPSFDLQLRYGEISHAESGSFKRTVNMLAIMLGSRWSLLKGGNHSLSGGPGFGLATHSYSGQFSNNDPISWTSYYFVAKASVGYQYQLTEKFMAGWENSFNWFPSAAEVATFIESSVVLGLRL